MSAAFSLRQREDSYATGRNCSRHGGGEALPKLFGDIHYGGRH
jgi:hypothetical protein